MYLPSVTKLLQGNIFTRILSTGGGGCLPQCMLGYTPPLRADTPPGRHPTRQTPLQSDIPPGQTPLLIDTPPGQTPLCRHPFADTPLGRPPSRRKLQWKVSILLKGFLVERVMFAGVKQTVPTILSSTEFKFVLFSG